MCQHSIEEQNFSIYHSVKLTKESPSLKSSFFSCIFPDRKPVVCGLPADYLLCVIRFLLLVCLLPNKELCLYLLNSTESITKIWNE